MLNIYIPTELSEAQLLAIRDGDYSINNLSVHCLELTSNQQLLVRITVTTVDADPYDGLQIAANIAHKRMKQLNC